MPRPAAASVAKAAFALMASLAVLGSVTHLPAGSAGAPPPPGLEVTGAGPAFTAHAGGDGPPVMDLAGLAPGGALSGTVTVQNRGPASRWVWLSRARMRRTGARGVQLTVLDVTDIDTPASVYRGPVATMGAQPLGFLPPEAARTYSFTADLPARRGAPGPPPAGVALGWHAVAGTPAVVTKARPAPVARKRPPVASSPGPQQSPPRDTRAPRARFSLSHRQRVLHSGTLEMVMRCTEACRARAAARVSTAGATWTAIVAGTRARRARHRLQVRLGPRAMASLRSALGAGRPARVKIRVRLRDRAGNRRRVSHTIRLLPRG
jgi:hypothetical protein